MTRRRFWTWIGAIATTGFVIRIVAVLTRQDLATTNSLFLIGGDGVDYHVIAHNLADGKGFVTDFGVGQTARPPVWPLLLAAVDFFTDGSMLAQQVMAVCVGTATIVVVGLCGRRLASERVGLVAAGLASMYPGFWIYEWALLSETLLLLAIACTLLVVYRFRERPSFGGALALGALCGVLPLIRAEQVLVSVLVVVPIILAARQRPWRTRLLWLASAAGVAVVLVSPWIVYNQGRFREPVYLSTGLGNTIDAGNCDSTYNGELLGLFDPACNFRVSMSMTAAENFDQSTRDVRLRSAAVSYMKGHTDRMPVVMLAREGRILGLYRMDQTAANWADWSRQPLVPVEMWMISGWVLICLAVYGAVVLRRRRVVIYPLVAFVAIVLVSTAATTGDVRYRAAAEVPLVLLAAVGIDGLVSRRRPPVAGAERRAGPSEDGGGVAAPDRPAVGAAPGPGSGTET